MARADVAVVGAGLAGLTAALSLAEEGARVHVLAAGQGASHWTHGGLDVGADPRSGTPADAVNRLAGRPGHPYRILGDALPDALAWLRTSLAGEGLELVGELGDPLRPIPTAIGLTRPAAIVPDAVAGALPRWGPDETLLVCGFAGFRDFWPDAIAAGLRGPAAWRGSDHPGRVEGLTVELPGLAGRHNLSGLDLARQFDDAAWRSAALEAIARAVASWRASAGPTGAGRLALPAVLGLLDHPAALAQARATLPWPPFEVALVPPSVPGLRLFGALRAGLLRHRGRLQVGEAVHGTIGADGHLSAVRAPAAAREFVLAADAFILATGGIAGGGLVAQPGGALVETVLGLPIELPGNPAGRSGLLLEDPFDPAGHPLELAGIRTDGQLRPVVPGASPDGLPLAANVRVAGSLLAGQRYLAERCGDGVALASGRLAAAGSRAS
jgi:glycerol-3-phosphate dehydrogenase subunit B